MVVNVAGARHIISIDYFRGQNTHADAFRLFLFAPISHMTRRHCRHGSVYRLRSRSSADLPADISQYAA